MSPIRTRLLLVPLWLLACLPAWSQDGLRMHPQTDWPRWQARLGLVTGNADLSLASASNWRSAQVLGDYYFAGPGFGAGRIGGGFRATSGVLLGSSATNLSTPAMASRQGLAFSARQAATSADSTDSQTLPYVGVGYSGVSLGGGWGFSADVGLVGVGGSGNGLNMGRMSSSQSLDEAWRDFRLAPVLQLGVSYSF